MTEGEEVRFDQRLANMERTVAVISEQIRGIVGTTNRIERDITEVHREQREQYVSTPSFKGLCDRVERQEKVTTAIVGAVILAVIAAGMKLLLAGGLQP